MRQVVARNVASMWTEFQTIESWTAIAASPDSRFVARAWRNGRGGAGVGLLDLDTSEDKAITLAGRTVVSLACLSLDSAAAVTVEDSDLFAQRLTVWDGDASRVVPLEAGRWALAAAETREYVMLRCHESATQLVIVSSEGSQTELSIEGLTVTSVVGVRQGLVYANAHSVGCAAAARLTTIDIRTGQYRHAAPGQLGVRLDGLFLVTTTIEDPETVAIIDLCWQADWEALVPDHTVTLEALAGEITIAAVDPAGERLLVGVRRGIDDACWRVDVETGAITRLSSELVAFGAFAMFDRGDACWLEISPSGRLALVRRPDGSTEEPGRDIAVVASPSLSWEAAVDHMRISTPEERHVVESLVLTPANWDGRLVVVMLHGGPKGRWSRKYDQMQQLLVGAGFRVVAPNTRGSLSDDQTFEKALEGRWGDVDQEDLVLLLAEVQANNPGSKVLLVGLSYGAYQAFQALISDPGSIAGAVLAAGFPSPEHLYARCRESTRRSLTSQGAIPSTWARGSTPRSSERRPVWVVHGRADVVVPPQLAVEVAAYLEDLDADVSMTVVPNAGHQVFDADEALHAELVRFAQTIAGTRDPIASGGTRTS